MTPSPSDLDRLRLVLARLSPLPDSEWEKLTKRLAFHRLPSGTILIEQGSPADRIHFVTQGLLKTVFREGEGDEITKGFIAEGGLAAPYVSILTGAPANFAVVALEDSETLSLAGDVLSSLYDAHPAWQQIGRKIAEGLVIERERREYQMLALDAEQRYRQFRRHFPHLLDRVPLYEVASYLGVTAVTLSQVRRKIARSRD